METVKLRSLFHKERACIGIYSQISGRLNYDFQKKAGAKWSQTNKCWYVPCTEKNYELLVKSLKGIAALDVEEFTKYLLERKKSDPSKASANNPAANQERPIKKAPLANTYKQVKPLQAAKPLNKLSMENYDALQKFRQQLVLKSYSPSTIKTYTNEFLRFLQAIKNVPASDFTLQRLKDYLQYCFEKLKLSENTLHSRMNAFKFYYEQVLKKEKFFWEIPRPKKPLLLPRFFNRDEIVAILKATSNLKHKVMLMLAYSGGLRVSEVVSLKTYQIDSRRMTIFISQAKGKKDRIVNLSPVLLVMLREYALAYKPAKMVTCLKEAPKAHPIVPEACNWF